MYVHYNVDYPNVSHPNCQISEPSIIPTVNIIPAVSTIPTVNHPNRQSSQPSIIRTVAGKKEERSSTEILVLKSMRNSAAEKGAITHCSKKN
jgi:hypothetical protein